MRLKLSVQQWDFIKKLGIEDKEYTQTEIDDFVIEKIADYLMAHGFNLGQESTNAVGDMCESIIDDIENQR